MPRTGSISPLVSMRRSIGHASLGSAGTVVHRRRDGSIENAARLKNSMALQSESTNRFCSLSWYSIAADADLLLVMLYIPLSVLILVS